MGIHFVQIVPAEETFSPPTEIIELAVCEDDTDQLVHEQTDDGRRHYALRHARKLVLLSLSSYEESNDGSVLKRKIEFPAIDLNDLVRALGVFGIAAQAWHLGDSPVRLPRVPEGDASEGVSG